MAGPGRRHLVVGLALAVGVWAILTALLIGTGELVLHSSAVADVDHQLTRTLVAHRGPVLDALMKVATWLGSWLAAVVVGIVVAVLVWRRRL
ncbi:MAG TPA: hypothetical protein VMU09_09500, partial [Acidimicrobiales bacterium]|nr:hypothetical protein [Acidimicrobiales bacterium]